MKSLEKLILTIISLPLEKHTRENVAVMKRKWAKEQGEKDVPSNIKLLKTYQSLINQGLVEKDRDIVALFKKRGVRSLSGIVPVQVLTKPFWCPGKCIFCPNDASMPKSYINTQPGAMRALLNNFDPYKQTYNRLLSLTMTGHETDKIEMIVLGGTWDVYPKQYKIDFVKGLYDACNNFTNFLQKIDINYENPKAARFTKTEDFDLTYPDTIEETLEIHETADRRIIGLTVETRPEYVTHENCQFWRELGVTRLEMGIQTLHNDVHEANVRGHDNQAIRDAMHMLRQYGFKVSNHYMPGLYMSTPQKDLETFHIAFSTPWIKSDELKFYPTAVIPNTPLYDLFKEGSYTPIHEKDLEHIVRVCKEELIPPYARIKRLARDFDTNEVVAGANTPNLRQLVMNAMKKEYSQDKQLRTQQYNRLRGSKVACVEAHSDALSLLKTPLSTDTKPYTSLSAEERDIDDDMDVLVLGGVYDSDAERNFVCLCTRCREVRNKNKDDNQEIPFLVVRRYRSSVGEELFISFEDSVGYLYGFTRLLLPDHGSTLSYPGLGHTTALIRELHVYGSLQSIQKTTTAVIDNVSQHKGFGSQLIAFAEEISLMRGYEKLSIIAGVGVRKYYEQKLGYNLEGTYMIKLLT